MIGKTLVWTFLYVPGRRSATPESDGKWIVHLPLSTIGQLVPTLDRLVEEGTLEKVKYAHKECPDVDPLPYDAPVVCVYAVDATKEKTLEVLHSLGIMPEEWKYDRDTPLDWRKGSPLNERMREQRSRYIMEQYLAEVWPVRKD